jgi:probable HAF family extracellular repeat protein
MRAASVQAAMLPPAQRMWTRAAGNRQRLDRSPMLSGLLLHRLLALAALSTVLLVPLVARAQAVGPKLEPVEILPRLPTMKDINSGGDIVAEGSEVSQVRRNGTITTLRRDGAFRTSANAMNDHGVVIGLALFPLPAGRTGVEAWWWYDGIFHPLPTLSDKTTTPLDINGRHVIVGSSWRYEGDTLRLRAVAWYGFDDLVDLNTVADVPSYLELTHAMAINDAGQIVGNAFPVTGGHPRAFLLDDGRFTDLGTLPGHLWSLARDINERGEVLVLSSDNAGTVHLALWRRETGLVDLGPLGGQSGVTPYTERSHTLNDAGLIVGPAAAPGTSTRTPHLWAYGRRIELISLVDNDRPVADQWRFFRAVDLNNAGQVLLEGAKGSTQASIRLDLFGCVDIDQDGGGDDDGDGLCDDWETLGIDVDLDGVVDLELYDDDGDGVVGPEERADPDHKDLYVEIDWMAQHRPWAAALRRVVRSFADAPVDNPDGLPGVRLHLVSDEEAAAHDDLIAFDRDPGVALQFDDVKARRFGRAGERTWPPTLDAKRLAFRYALFAHGQPGGYGGLAEVHGNDLLVTLGSFQEVLGHGAGDVDAQASGLMHELGHTLGLRHGGGDAVNCKPNYMSIMNYNFAYDGDPIVGRRLDYSREILPTLDERDLSEPLGIQGPAGEQTAVQLPPPLDVPVAVPADGPIDWNADGNSEGIGVAADVTGICDRTNTPVLVGWNDWATLRYGFVTSFNFGDGPRAPEDLPEELTFADVVATSPDSDGDGVPNALDVCMTVADDQSDADSDGVGDVCDNCPLAVNPGQEDADDDGVGDDCELDPACVPETCNGVDDDCDGEIDNGLGAVSCGVGECSRTVDACTNGEPQVCAPGEPAPEVCDGEDRDCDGLVDAADPDCAPPPPAGVHDLAVTRIAAPRRLAWKDGAITSVVKVQVQNRSPRAETIPDAAVLRNLVRLDVQAVDPARCPPPTVALAARQPKLPKVLAPKAKLGVAFEVTFACVLDPGKSTKRDRGHEDYVYAATVDRAELDGNADTHPADDHCPRAALGVDPNPDGRVKDRGCAVAYTDLVAEVE